MRSLMWLALAASLTACNPFACDEERNVLEIEYGGPFEELQEEQLASYRENGWSCSSDGALRDFAGRVIGERYVCTRCE